MERSILWCPYLSTLDQRQRMLIHIFQHHKFLCWYIWNIVLITFHLISQTAFIQSRECKFSIRVPQISSRPSAIWANFTFSFLANIQTLHLHDAYSFVNHYSHLHKCSPFLTGLKLFYNLFYNPLSLKTFCFIWLLPFCIARISDWSFAAYQYLKSLHFTPAQFSTCLFVFQVIVPSVEWSCK